MKILGFEFRSSNDNNWASLVKVKVKNLPTVWDTLGLNPGLG